MRDWVQSCSQKKLIFVPFQKLNGFFKDYFWSFSLTADRQTGSMGIETGCSKHVTKSHLDLRQEYCSYVACGQQPLDQWACYWIDWFVHVILGVAVALAWSLITIYFPYDFLVKPTQQLRSVLTLHVFLDFTLELITVVCGASACRIILWSCSKICDLAAFDWVAIFKLWRCDEIIEQTIWNIIFYHKLCMHHSCFQCVLPKQSTLVIQSLWFIKYEVQL